MARFIDADRALEIVYEHGIAHPNAYHLTNYATLILREAPTVDAVEVVNGRWIGVDSSYWRRSHDGGHTVEHITFRCSECARKSIIKTNYCPNCGAKMDGECGD